MKNKTLKSLSFLMLAVFSLVTVAPQRGHAQESEASSSAKADAEVARMKEIFALRHERASIHKGGPIAGIVLSPLLILGSVPMLVIGSIDWSEDGQGRSPGLIAAGAFSFVGGIAAVAASAASLRKRKNQIRDIDERIQYLQMRGADRASISFGPPQNPAFFRFGNGRR